MTSSGDALSGPGIRHVFVRDMVLTASIGIYAHEHSGRQRVRINVDLAVDDESALAGLAVGPDELSRVVNYEKIIVAVRAIVGNGHTRLVETMANGSPKPACVTRGSGPPGFASKSWMLSPMRRRPAWRSSGSAKAGRRLPGRRHIRCARSDLGYHGVERCLCGFPVTPVAIGQNPASRGQVLRRNASTRSVVTVVEMIFPPLDDRVSFPVCDQQMTTLLRDDCDSHGILLDHL